MNDLIHFTMARAVRRFQRDGSHDSVFNGAAFAQEFRDISGVNSLLDGQVVAAILCGRSDVLRLEGGSHYLFIENSP
jgi:hypothetical protein